MKNSLMIMLLGAILLTACGDQKTYIVIETEYGDMKAELYDSTPKHKENMVKLVKEGFYKDLLFHRVINGFMIQGGDPDSRGAEKGARLGMGGPGYTIEAEIGSPHFKGALAAARSPNPEKRSSGSQFYIVQGSPQTDAQLDNFERQKGIQYNQAQREKYKTIGGYPGLDMEYTVFGEVVEGMDVIDKIAGVLRDQYDRPIKDVKMNIRLSN